MNEYYYEFDKEGMDRVIILTFHRIDRVSEE